MRKPRLRGACLVSFLLQGHAVSAHRHWAGVVRSVRRRSDAEGGASLVEGKDELQLQLVVRLRVGGCRLEPPLDLPPVVERAEVLVQRVETPRALVAKRCLLTLGTEADDDAHVRDGHVRHRSNREDDGDGVADDLVRARDLEVCEVRRKCLHGSLRLS